MSNETLKKALKLLLSEHYIVFVEGKPMLTGKLTREIEQIKAEELYDKPTEPIEVVEEIPEPTRSLTPVNAKTKAVILTPGIQQPFAEFIMKCEVPQRIKMDNGNFFWANKYSKEAEKEFKSILAQGYQEDILIAATKLYYKSGGTCEAVSNYIIRGSWLTQYQAMEQSLQAGTVNKHITDSLSTNSEGKPSYTSR